jgi:hypothetical protein
MAKFSMKKQGKEVGPASTYAKPHSMEGSATNVNTYNKYTPGAKVLDESNPSVAGISKGNYKTEKTTGIKIRGTGAATKGTMARGPMG